MFGVILNIGALYVVLFIRIVNIEKWSPSNSIGSPSTNRVYRPTMSATPTDLENIGKKPNFMHVLNM